MTDINDRPTFESLMGYFRGSAITTAQELQDKHVQDGVELAGLALARLDPLNWLTPTNLKSVQAEVRDSLQGRTTATPVTYAEFDWALYRASVSDLRKAARLMAGNGLASYIEREAELADQFAARIQAGSLAAVMAWGDDYYGYPSPATLTHALEILSVPPKYGEPKLQLIDAAQVTAQFEAVLLSYGLIDWTVSTGNSLPRSIDVDVDVRKILIRSDIKVNRQHAHRLSVRVIGAAVLRHVNASQQREPLARLPLGGAAAAGTRDGLATWLEYDLGVGDEESLRVTALRTLAIEWGMTKTVSDLAHHLARYVSVEQAVQIAVDTKLGMTDMNAYGSSSRGHIGLSGYLAVREYLGNSRADLPLLMSTEWSIQMLPAARTALHLGKLQLNCMIPDSRLLLPKPDESEPPQGLYVC